MKRIGQGTSGPESWGLSGNPPHKKNVEIWFCTTSCLSFVRFPLECYWHVPGGKFSRNIFKKVSHTEFKRAISVLYARLIKSHCHYFLVCSVVILVSWNARKILPKVYEVSSKIIMSNDNVFRTCMYSKMDLLIPLSSRNCEMRAVIGLLCAEERRMWETFADVSVWCMEGM